MLKLNGGAKACPWFSQLLEAGLRVLAELHILQTAMILLHLPVRQCRYSG